MSNAPERDPRVTPMPGDVLRKASRPIDILDYEVTHRCSGPRVTTGRGSVYLRDQYGRGYNKPYETFLKWAATAEIVRRAEENHAE